MLAIAITMLLALMQREQTAPPRDYTVFLIGISVTVGLFLIGHTIVALLWGGRITERLENLSKNLTQILSEVPKKGDVSAEISKMQNDLLKYINERDKPDAVVLAAVAELKQKVEAITPRTRR